MFGAAPWGRVAQAGPGASGGLTGGQGTESAEVRVLGRTESGRMEQGPGRRLWCVFRRRNEMKPSRAVTSERPQRPGEV